MKLIRRTLFLGLQAIAVVAVLGLASYLARPSLIAAPPKEGADRIGSLIRQLGSDNLQERHWASQELVRIGAPALEPLKQALKDTKQEIAIHRCITEIEKDDLEIWVLMKGLRSRNPEERAEATAGLRGLRGHRAEQALPNLMEDLADENPKLQERALWALPASQPGVVRAWLISFGIRMPI